MAHLFFDVFSSLNLNDDDRELFEETRIERLVSSSRRDRMQIHLSGDYIIPKDRIYAVEKEIEKQIFAQSPCSVKIIERFNLSDSYSAQSVFKIYKNSLMLEAGRINPAWSDILNHADFEFSEDGKGVLVVLEDRFIVRDMEKDILDFLENAINVRCGLSVRIQSAYKDREIRKSVVHSESRMLEEVRKITDNIGKSEDEFVNYDSAEEDNPSEKNGNSSDGFASDADRKAGTNITGDAGEQVTKSEKAAKKNDYKKNDVWKSDFPRRSHAIKQSANPDVIFGNDFIDGPMNICDIDGDIGLVTVRGQVFGLEERETRTGKKMVLFSITDFTDSISVKMFPRPEQQDRLLDYLKDGAFVLIKGNTGIDKFDGLLSLGYIDGIKKTFDFRTKRTDNEATKRVELHCHTKMSDMDGVSEVADIIECARGWGHDAIAVTDHGVVQAFTEAFHHIRDKKIKDFKIIYGMEGYLVDDENEIVHNPKDLTAEGNFVAVEIKTTGSSARENSIIEIGAVKICGNEITDEFSTLVNPGEPILYRVEKETGISDSMVADAPFINDAMSRLEKFCAGSVLLSFNASLCMEFLSEKGKGTVVDADTAYVDVLGLARLMVPEISRFSIDSLCRLFKINHDDTGALGQACAVASIFLKLRDRLSDEKVERLATVNEMASSSEMKIRKSPSNHIILLAANETGRVNLYRLVSASHVNYYHGQPKIPKSMIRSHREGIIIGSACEQGELYQAILHKKSDDEIIRIAKFYDYLEIQPNGNNEFMIREEEYDDINSHEDLEKINRKIVELGEQLGKPVVATCDVHFLNPEDEIYRRVLMAGKGFKDADLQAPLYLRTTREMLEEFDYLGYDKAYEVVVTNTRKIADMIEVIEPVRPDKCPPVIEDSDKTLTEICYRRAKEIYGEELPPQVSGRLDKELHSIISNGFAVMYIIAQKLVWKSNEDGYLVGSRGSVGSSFVATMAGITEVNPLSPHYYCPSCHYVDFDSDEVKSFAGRAGCDMPDKACPKCGAMLKKDGFDIPFETFLGFKGDKEPDIDLNFSGEYQSKAHKYTEVIFGAGQTFRAGTIGTIAEKTAYGYVKKYYEEKGIDKRPCEIDRISKGCTGVRRTTGQHPGGIIVLPMGEEIHSFTPIQHPADDMSTDIITTHFDYHSIDHNLLKLDILGHDDPTMIRMLQDLTGTDPKEVALDDKDVMSIFRSTEKLGIEPEDIGGCKLGCLGIPEFGTDFVIQMLLDTKPSAFSDLVRISGLSHGTDVWLNNAQTVIAEGKATISTAICTRDDIMTYLINMGVESSLAFNIMEKVRKGTVAKGKCADWPAWKEEMLSKGVPDWYVWSCEKIKYMFPKAHAAAYVMMAWRIAYYKINYPLAYYAAYFSIRASAFSYETMCRGKDVLAEEITKYRKMADSSEKMTSKQDNTLKDLKIAEEMYARGYEFMPIDIFTAKAHQCQIIDGKIMPRLDCIDGLGDKAADGVADAVKDGKFLSLDDFQERTKVSRTVIDHMVDLGILDGLPGSNQLSLFDFA